MSNPLIFSGATRNRNLRPSGSISSLFRIASTAISSYCSTVGLLRSAHRCMWFHAAKVVILIEKPKELSDDVIIPLLERIVEVLPREISRENISEMPHDRYDKYPHQ